MGSDKLQHLIYLRLICEEQSKLVRIFHHIYAVLPLVTLVLC